MGRVSLSAQRHSTGTAASARGQLNSHACWWGSQGGQVAWVLPEQQVSAAVTCRGSHTTWAGEWPEVGNLFRALATRLLWSSRRWGIQGRSGWAEEGHGAGGAVHVTPGMGVGGGAVPEKT